MYFEELFEACLPHNSTTYYLLVQPPAMNVSGQTSEESH